MNLQEWLSFAQSPVANFAGDFDALKTPMVSGQNQMTMQRTMPQQMPGAQSGGFGGLLGTLGQDWLYRQPNYVQYLGNYGSQPSTQIPDTYGLFRNLVNPSNSAAAGFRPNPIGPMQTMQNNFQPASFLTNLLYGNQGDNWGGGG